MKAYILENIGQLSYRDVDDPVPAPGWAVVRVKAAGICSSDIPRIFTKGTYHFPTIPGHELSGMVERVGAPADSAWTGRRVGIFPLIPCKSCPQCAVGKYELCEHYDYIGSRRDGGFAELVAVPVWNLIELPEAVSYETAAMLEPLSVAYHAAKRGEICPGDAFAVVGTGMIGLAAAQWARSRHASRVCVFGRNQDKRELVEQLSGIAYSTETKSHQSPGFDVVIEAVGTPASIADAIQLARPGGRIVLMGNPSGEIPLSQDVYWRILRKQLRLTGTWNSSYDGPNASDWTEALSALAEGRIQVSSLITHRFSQEHLEEGLSVMRGRREPYCKVITVWNAPK